MKPVSKKQGKRKKVGRPRLADKHMKKESIIVCAFNLIILAGFAAIAYNILTIDVNPKYYVGTIYNDHVNKCILDETEIDCGPNVKYIKYSTNNKNYKELVKEGKSLKIKINNNDKVKFCYKTSIDESKCTK